uniref:C2H2-type domain-containing protein n=1 Tax=Musca domestica TaxID=7370 RepID=A0A1I8MN15_MUSDO
MATVIPPTSNVEAAYEDMFKEITRKLYGEETGNGLHTLGTPVAQVATTGPTAAPEGEQRSFTNLQIDRSTQPTIEYEHNTSNVVGTTTAGSTTSAAAASAAAVIAAATSQQNATNVVIQQQPEGSVVVTTTTSAGGNFKSEDHLSTAFGLAALMQQNGFATTTGTILSSQAINKVITTAAGSQQAQQQQQQQQMSGGDQQQQVWSEGVQDQQQQQQSQATPTTQIVQWTTTPSGKLQSYSTTTAQPQTQQQQQQQQSQQQVSTPKSKNKNRNDQGSSPSTGTAEVIYTSPTATGNNISQQQTPQSSANTSSSSTTSTSSSGGSSGGSSSRKKSHHNQNSQNTNNSNGQSQVQKRYACTHCPYSTDRRDLYTRHENIHKDEKPFQCYACLKQFNRADHVKKHFLRMHREMQYDINKTRRHVPSSNSSGGHHHGGGRSNVTITAVNTSPSNLHNDGNAIEQKPIIFQTQANVNLEQAFLEQQRQPTSSSLSIAETIEAVATATDVPLPQLKQEKNDDGTLVGGQTASVKPKREKRFTCCYCPWSGADKWGLKRHLNTHTKPFVCLLCDYKAARSERLATHVLKVHNKRACNKCSFLGDSLEEYQQHLNEVHLLKMDAISRNTASVAQDFHKAGGVQELKLPANHQLLFNNKLPSQWTTKEAAALLQSLSNANNLSYVYQQQQRSKHAHHQNGFMRQRQHSHGDDSENTPSTDTSTTSLSDDLSPLKMEQSRASVEQRKMISSAFLQDSLSNSSEHHGLDSSSSSSNNNISHHYHDDQENQEQLIRSSPAYKTNNYYMNNNNNNNNINNKNNNNNNINKIKSSNKSSNSANSNTMINNNIQQQHRVDLHNKENNSNATFLTQMEFQNLNKIGTQFQNYVKDIISKYYAADTPVMFPNMPIPTATAQQSQQRLVTHISPKRKRLLSETEEYIEYLKNKEDITLTITPKLADSNSQLQQQSPTPQYTKPPLSPLKRERDLASDSYRRHSPKKPIIITSTPQASNQKSCKKSISQLATLLPLLADAASQQQYLTAPLDFSKKSSEPTIPHIKQESDAKPTGQAFLNIINDAPAIKEEPQNPNESQTPQIAYADVPPPASATTPPLHCSYLDKRSSRKQAQPKKMRLSPDLVVAALRDKYLNRMVDRMNKLSCADCVKMKRTSMLVFNYHTKASLCLHRLWKHAEKPIKCKICGDKFRKKFSLILHTMRMHEKATVCSNRKGFDH